MQTLILSELKKLIPIFLLIYAGLLLYDYLLGTWVFVWMLPIISPFIANRFIKRSAWYLSLPWSRLRLLVVIVLQNLIIFLGSAAVASVILYLKGVYRFSQKYEGDIYISLVFWCSGILFGLVQTLVGVQILNAGFLGNLKSRKVAIRLVLVGIFYFIVWKTGLYREPILYFSLFVGLLLWTFVFLCVELVFPKNNLQLIRKTAVFSGVGIVAASIAGAVIYGNLASPSNPLIETSFDYLHRFPSFISDERALQVFTESRIGPSIAMEKHLEFLRKSVGFAEWEKRTRKCKGTLCFDFSSDVVDLNSLTKAEAAKRFHILMHSCDLKLNEGYRVKCGGAHASSTKIRHWTDQLAKLGVLDDWLSSKDPVETTYALKGLAYSFAPAQEKKIQALRSSTDLRVATTANAVILARDNSVALKLDCKAVTTKISPECKARNSGEGMF